MLGNFSKYHTLVLWIKNPLVMFSFYRIFLCTDIYTFFFYTDDIHIWKVRNYLSVKNVTETQGICVLLLLPLTPPLISHLTFEQVICISLHQFSSAHKGDFPATSEYFINNANIHRYHSIGIEALCIHSNWQEKPCYNQSSLSVCQYWISEGWFA